MMLEMTEAYNAAQWRARAEEASAVADGMKDPEARRTMERIAAGYRNLAEQAQRVAAEARSGPVGRSGIIIIPRSQE